MKSDQCEVWMLLLMAWCAEEVKELQMKCGQEDET